MNGDDEILELQCFQFIKPAPFLYVMSSAVMFISKIRLRKYLQKREIHPGALTANSSRILNSWLHIQMLMNTFRKLN